MEANKSFYTLLAISAFALLMVFGLLTKIVPLVVAHTIYYCQAKLSNIVFTLPHSFPSILVLALSLVILVGFSLLVFQLSKTAMFVRKVLKNKVKTPNKVRVITIELGIQDRLVVVKSRTLPSFCYGYIKPRICLSSSLIKSLSEGELKAVLLHESYHLKHRDPLKILLSQVAATMFFFVPILKDIHSHYALSKEISADQQAIKTNGLTKLRSALIKALNFSNPSLSGIAAFENESNLEKRIMVLTNRKDKFGLRISAVKLFISFLVFVFTFILLNLPVHAMEMEGNHHAYFICNYGDKCLLACSKGETTIEAPFSTEKPFTPADYSPTN